jgi:hypothetical protein
VSQYDTAAGSHTSPYHCALPNVGYSREASTQPSRQYLIKVEEDLASGHLIPLHLDVLV